jgi:hypothetical protein
VSVDTGFLSRDELPSTRAQIVVGKASQVLLYALCAAPVALFPIGLVYKLYIHFFP